MTIVLSDEEIARNAAAAALGVEQSEVSAWRPQPQAHPRLIQVEITISKAITFAMLQRLSDALGTEAIDIQPAEEGHQYSSWTYEDGVPAKIVATLQASATEEKER